MKKLIAVLLFVGCSYNPTEPEPEPSLKPLLQIKNDTIITFYASPGKASYRATIYCQGEKVSGVGVWGWDELSNSTRRMGITNDAGYFDARFEVIGADPTRFYKVKIWNDPTDSCGRDTIVAYFKAGEGVIYNSKTLKDYVLAKGGFYDWDFRLERASEGITLPGQIVEFFDPIQGANINLSMDSNANANYRVAVPATADTGTYTFYFRALKAGFIPYYDTAIVRVN